MHLSRRSLCSAGLLLTALGVSGCGASGSGESSAKLARVSGDVAAAPGAPATVNLAIVAPNRDRIWDGISEIVMSNDLPSGADAVLTGGSAELTRGQTRGGLRVGTLILPIPDDAAAFTLSSVSLTLASGGVQKAFNIGRWHMSRRADKPLLEIAGDYPASMETAGPVSFELRGHGISSDSISRIASDAEGISLRNPKVADGPEGTVQVSFDTECNDAFDLFGFSPRLTLETRHGAVEQLLDPILVGYLNMSEEAARRIAER